MMLNNLPIVTVFKRLTGTDKDPSNSEIILEPLYIEEELKPWEVEISEYDKLRIKQAIKTGQPMYIAQDLTDAQLLRLHFDSLPDANSILIYHEMFDLYELKIGDETEQVFSFLDGIYRPYADIF